MASWEEGSVAHFSKTKNFYIKDGKAFTEDDVLIYNLFVCNIPRKVTIADLRTYFSTYGHLERVHFIPEKKRNNKPANKMAFVHFQSAVSAAKALRVEHHICFKRILVKASDSWHQPNANKTDLRNNSKKSDIIADFDIPPNSILILNDDCLEHILKKLELRDQIRLSRTCNRMRDLFIQNSKLLYKRLELSDLEEMTLWEIYELFSMIGDVITQITGELPETNRERIIEFISKYCNRLLIMDLELCELRTKHVNKLFLGLNNIVELNLSYCGLTDSSIVALRKLHVLKKLNLSYNFELTGNHISTLSKTIEVLALISCNCLTPNNITCFLRALINLKELNLKEWYWSRPISKAMATHCKQLEVLKMDAITEDFEPVAKLPKLKRLVLFGDSVDLSHILSALVKHKSEQLEYLHVGAMSIDKDATQKISQLHALRTLVCPKTDELDEKAMQCLCDLPNLEDLVLSDCTQVNDTAVLRIALACTKLKQIHLQHCYFITDNLVFELIKKFKEQIKSKTYKREGPIHIMVDNTKINKYILNDPEYISAANILRVYFKDAPRDLLKYDVFEDIEDQSVHYNWDDLDENNILDDMFPTDDEDDDDDEFMNDFHYGADSDDGEIGYDDDIWMFDANRGIFKRHSNTNSGIFFFMG